MHGTYIIHEMRMMCKSIQNIQKKSTVTIKFHLCESGGDQVVHLTAVHIIGVHVQISGFNRRKFV